MQFSLVDKPAPFEIELVRSFSLLGISTVWSPFSWKVFLPWDFPFGEISSAEPAFEYLERGYPHTHPQLLDITLVDFPNSNGAGYEPLVADLVPTTDFDDDEIILGIPTCYPRSPK